jgi:fermentation-respiration switch protein FrsA (DUF1100 family)
MKTETWDGFGEGDCPVSGQRFRKRTRVAIRFLLMLAVGLVLYLRLFESRLLFYPDSSIAEMPSVPYEDVHFRATDGTALHAWFIPFANSPRVFLISHGNAGNIGDRAVLGEFVRNELRSNVLMYDYRGYGKSAGKASESGLYSDIDAAFRYLQAKGFAWNSIYLIGQSLGTAVTIDLASRERVAGVILEAPFPSVRVLARRIAFSIPVDYVLSSRFDTLSKLGRVRAPILVIHDRRDPVIPFDLGQQVFDAISGPKQFIAVDAGFHEGAMLAADARSIRNFLGGWQ